MRFQYVLVATISPFITAAVMGDLVEYEATDRAVSAFMDFDGGTFQDTDSVWWYSAIEQGNEFGVVRAYQQSDLAQDSLMFEGETQAIGGPFLGDAYSSSTLSTMISLDSDVHVDLDWSYLLELEGVASGGAHMRISTIDGFSLYDMDLQFDGASSASSDMELIAGSYLLEIDLGSSVTSSTASDVTTSFQVSMDFTAVPSAGALAILPLVILVIGTRRRDFGRDGP
ncbi:MAG: hypothetical protein MK095_10885 [Phycisphaerales bacterium]|nr:hypothetical protein [Phycisphaerales bacterium]